MADLIFPPFAPHHDHHYLPWLWLPANFLAHLACLLTFLYALNHTEDLQLPNYSSFPSSDRRQRQTSQSISHRHDIPNTPFNLTLAFLETHLQANTPSALDAIGNPRRRSAIVALHAAIQYLVHIHGATTLLVAHLLHPLFVTAYYANRAANTARDSTPATVGPARGGDTQDKEQSNSCRGRREGSHWSNLAHLAPQFTAYARELHKDTYAKRRRRMSEHPIDATFSDVPCLRGHSWFVRVHFVQYS